jgi:hypothetical protein
VRSTRRIKSRDRSWKPDAGPRRDAVEHANIASKARNQKRITISPIAFEAVQKFDAIIEVERSISGSSPEARLGGGD